MIRVPSQPFRGAVGLTKIHGSVGLGVRIGQWLCGGGFRNYEHTFVCVAVSANGIATVVEAEPGGARLGYYGPKDVLWLDYGYSAEQYDAVAAAALRYVGVGYSFLDYLAIALHRLRIPAPRLKRYIASTGHMICSQLVDQAYEDAGLHLFDDGRWPGYVKPGDLLYVRKGR